MSLISRRRLGLARVYEIGRAKLYVCHEIGMLSVQIGASVIDLDWLIRPVMALMRRARRRMRELLPSFWAIGLRDCDTGGRVFAWRFDWAWNDNHFRRVIYPRWDGAGDGEVWEQLTFLEYLRARKEERAARS